MKLGRVIAVIVLVPVAGYVTWDQIESRGLARDIAAISGRGEPITLEAEPTGADTPERHDAARIYAAAAERTRGLPQEITYRLGSLDVDTPVRPPLDLDQLEKTYRPDSPPLQLLDQATPLDFNGFGDVPLERNNSPLNTLSYLAALRADLYSARGRGDAAAEALIPCVRLWRALPSFERAWSTTRLLGSVRIMLRHTVPSESALAALRRTLSEVPDRDDLANDVMQRRAFFIDEMSAPRNSAAELILRRLVRPWAARANRRTLQSFAEALEISRRPWPDKYIVGAAAQETYGKPFRETRQPGFFQRMTREMSYPYGIGIITTPFAQAGLELASRRVIAAALAVESYRRTHGETLPPSLDALVPAYLPSVPVDPFSGKALVYQLAADHYRLYSVDVNRRDDGGAIYGIGSGGQRAPLQGAQRDLGIRVDMRK